MAEPDPAFLWETEALRTMARPASNEIGRHVAPAYRGPVARPGWVTLREASETTGIPIATLRSWVRKGRLPNVVDETELGTRRMVPLDRVLARAEQLGREVEVVDLHPAGTRADQGTPDAPPGPPPGTMLVPIEAWDKMLLQLGNLHEAGQQLAEARERAARAETEATFLRERLTELRAEIAASRPTGREDGDGSGESPAPTVTTRPSFTAYLWRSATSRMRLR